MNQRIFDKTAVKNNINYYLSAGKKITVMVKANAYGHGIANILNCLEKYDIKLGVATLKEAQDLREMTTKQILIVEPMNNVQEMQNNDFQFCVEDYDLLVESFALGIADRCYLKLNVGMNRFGINIYDSKMIKKVSKLLRKHRIKGLMCHFPCLEDEKTTRNQYEQFIKAKNLLSGKIKNSNGNVENNFDFVSFGGSNIIKYPFVFDEVRVGICFYGYENENVSPIMTLKSQILKTITLKKGDFLGYSRGYVATQETLVAIVGVGYADGISRALKGFYVKINGQKCEIIGNICMDCLFVNVTNRCIQVGDEVVIENADMVANYLNTISYEVLTSENAFRGENIFV